MANFTNPGRGGAVDLYARIEVPKYASGDSEYAHKDFQGGRRRGYVKKTPGSTAGDTSQTLLDVGLRREHPPSGKVNVPNYPESLSSKGVTLRSGHRIQKNVPLHLELSGNIGLSVTVGSNNNTCALIWTETTIAGVTPKIIEACVIPVIAYGTVGVGTIPVKDISSTVLLSKDIDLNTEVNVKTDLKLVLLDNYAETLHSTNVKNLVSGSAIGTTATKQNTSSLALQFSNTVMHIWQPASGRDVNN